MKKLISMFSAILVMLLHPVKSHGEDDYYAKTGFYLGISIPYNTIDGDFDGDTYLSDGYSLALVPEVEDNFGWGIMIGSRFTKGAVELSYLKSTHDVTWAGAKGEADLNMVSLDFKYFFLADKPIQPFVSGGFVFPWLVVKDGYYDSLSDSIGDATYTGYGLGLGGGLSFYFHPRIALHGGIIYRYINYTKVEDGIIDDDLSGNGLSYNAAITFTF